uniref:Uncharacterized protein n=1 Tax=Anguilla anguilla TaxID=7936 RepID=A0A0E9RUG8_ANGAN
MKSTLWAADWLFHAIMTQPWGDCRGLRRLAVQRGPMRVGREWGENTQY